MNDTATEVSPHIAADLRRKLEESLAQQAATADVLKVISRSTFDLQTVLETLINSAVKLCGANRGSIFLRDGDVFPLRAASSTTPEFLQYWAAHPPRAGRGSATARVIASGKVEIIADVLADPEMEMSAPSLNRIRAALGVPLLRDDRVEGVMVLTRPEPGPFAQSQIDLVQMFADQAMIAIENTRLINETQQALERQTATAEILKVIASSPSDVQPVFDAIANRSKQLIGGFSCTVFRLIDGIVHLVAYTSVSAAADEVLKGSFPRPVGEMALFDKATSADVVEEPDSEKNPDARLRELARARGFRGTLFARLMNKGTVVGLIAVTRVQPGSFDPHHVQLLRTFADQAVIAIENARLFNETREALERQTVTADILKVIASSPSDVQPVFEAIAASANRLLGGFSTAVFRFADGIAALAAFTPVNPVADALLRSNFPAPLSTFAPFEFAASGRPIQIADTRQASSPQIAEIAKARGFRSMLFVPLMNNGAPIGLISVTRTESGAFAHHHVQLLQTFADQAVIAIENVRLFEEVQARTRDLGESLQQQTATADVLKVISRSAFDLDAVLNTLVTSAAQLCAADAGIIWLRKDDLFHASAAAGFSPEEMAFFRANPRSIHDKSLAPRVLRSRETVHIPDRSLDPEFAFPGAPELPQSMLGVPLLRNDVVEGVFTLTRAQVAPFTQRQIELVESFADQAVIAIENVRLFEEVQARTRELSQSLEDLRTAQDRLVQTEKLASLGQLTAGIAHEIKNPLNFVNNFSSLSAELIDEVKDLLKQETLTDKGRDELEELTGLLKDNLGKVVQHGKRADSIVKNMLQHSREGSGECRSADINALVGESLNLAYHGARAEKAGFNIKLEQDFDPEAGTLELYPQEMTRALLNLISNGFYAVSKKAAADGAFAPVLSAATKNLGKAVEIRIRDNGTGISPEVKEKMFNPFFTTKPTGEGTGLGLSMTHDIIVKQHGGRIDVATEPGAFTEFIITLPRKNGAADGSRPD